MRAFDQRSWTEAQTCRLGCQSTQGEFGLRFNDDLALAGSIVIETQAELACVAWHPRRLVWPSVRDLWSNALTGVRQLAPVV